MEARGAVRFGREGTGAFAPVTVSQSAHSRTQQDTSQASPPLVLLLQPVCESPSAPPEQLVLKLKVNPLTLSSAGKTSHSVAFLSLSLNSITSPPSLRRQPAVSGLAWAFRRLLLMYSPRLDHCGSVHTFGHEFQDTSHHISELSAFMTLRSTRGSPLTLTFTAICGWSVPSRLHAFISVLCIYVECCGRGHLASLTAGRCFSTHRGVYGKSPCCFVFCSTPHCCSELNLKSG